jgi:hypothetical protein
VGRDKRNESGKGQHWGTQILRSTLDTPAWRALTPSAQAAYPWLRMEWKGPNANYNGRLRLSLSQLAERMGCNIKTAGRAFHDLQAKGFVVVTEGAHLGSEGTGTAPAYELTEIALPGVKPPVGRNLFKAWTGEDFAVYRAPANNPLGINRKTKSHAQNGLVATPK